MRWVQLRFDAVRLPFDAIRMRLDVERRANGLESKPNRTCNTTLNQLIVRWSSLHRLKLCQIRSIWPSDPENSARVTVQVSSLYEWPFITEFCRQKVAWPCDIILLTLKVHCLSRVIMINSPLNMRIPIQSTAVELWQFQSDRLGWLSASVGSETQVRTTTCLKYSTFI